MNKLIVFGILVLLLVSCVSAYYCIEEDDNKSVKEFKSKINILALKEDIYKNKITEEGLFLKLKYFSGCK